MKRLRFKKSVYWLLAINGFLLILLACGCLRWHILAQQLDSQYAAERWGQDMKFAQVSCFLPVDNTLKEEDIRTFRDKLDSALTAAAVEPLSEGGALYTDAYAAFGTLSLSGEHGSSSAAAVAIAGDWFTFHPLRLLSGSYISGSDLMADRVVLDKELAFNLFGSVDVAGLTVTVNKQPYLVAGVVEREQDKFSQQVNSSGATVYVLLDSKLVTAPITCYELVMAEPLTGFTAGAVTDNFPLGNGVSVQNSGRFTVTRIDDLLFHFAQRGVSQAGIAFPWWENAARVSENHLALLLAALAPLPLLPLVCIVWLMVLLFRQVKGKLAQHKAARDYQNQEQDPAVLEAELRELEKRQMAAVAGDVLPEQLTWEELEENLLAEEAAKQEKAAEPDSTAAESSSPFAELPPNTEAPAEALSQPVALDALREPDNLEPAPGPVPTYSQTEPEMTEAAPDAAAEETEVTEAGPEDVAEEAGLTEAKPETVAEEAGLTEAESEAVADEAEPESLAEARVAAVLQRYLHHNGEVEQPENQKKQRKQRG